MYADLDLACTSVGVLSIFKCEFKHFCHFFKQTFHYMQHKYICCGGFLSSILVFFVLCFQISLIWCLASCTFILTPVVQHFSWVVSVRLYGIRT